MEPEFHDTYSVHKIPVMRRFSLDNGRMSSRRNFFHALLEVDVTEPRRLIREHKARTGEAISFTAFIVYCLGQALEVHKELTAFRDWRGRLIVFDDVNINTMVEADFQEVNSRCRTSSGAPTAGHCARSTPRSEQSRAGQRRARKPVSCGLSCGCRASCG